MKRFVLILAAAVAALTISSCKKDNGTKTVTVTVSVDESAVEAGIAKPDSYVITVTNNSTTTAVTANTENGKAEFSGLVPGIYSVAANAVVVTDGRQYVFTGTEASVDATDLSSRKSIIPDARSAKANTIPISAISSGRSTTTPPRLSMPTASASRLLATTMQAGTGAPFTSMISPIRRNTCS